MCRGLYQNGRTDVPTALVLHHAAAQLRNGCLLYLSLESVLSKCGVISQQPIDRIMLMTSGRKVPHWPFALRRTEVTMDR